MLSSMVAEPPALPPVALDCGGSEGESAVALEFREGGMKDLDVLVRFESSSQAWLTLWLRGMVETASVLDGLCLLMDRHHLDELVLTPEFLAQWARWEKSRANGRIGWCAR